ncbi:hypothetical protein [Yersinia mollaretii]|uniref:hypothetical protein n=1 Tax=Yersinia mollaretii TaxID=33060 RepID=UPI0011A18E44|nr:hypothetical protein [Yersinia mollaretii]
MNHNSVKLNDTPNDVELVALFSEARRAARLFLLELLVEKLTTLSTDDSTKEDVIKELTAWATERHPHIHPVTITIIADPSGSITQGGK